MKRSILLALLIGAAGCHQKSPFDVSADDVQKHFAAEHPGMPSGPPDINHLPPGAQKEEHVYHKGDRLPDGTIATGDQKMVTVHFGGPNGGGAMAVRQMGPGAGPGGKMSLSIHP